MSDPRLPASQSRRSHLIRRPDVIVLVVVAIGTPIVLFSLPGLLDRVAPTPAPHTAPLSAGVFVATPEQWSTLGFANSAKLFGGELSTLSSFDRLADGVWSAAKPFSRFVSPSCGRCL